MWALLEDCHYDRETGQLLAASFIDYAMPRADLLPALATALSEVPAPSNRLWVRSGGEGGTTPALMPEKRSPDVVIEITDAGGRARFPDLGSSWVPGLPLRQCECFSRLRRH